MYVYVMYCYDTLIFNIISSVFNFVFSMLLKKMLLFEESCSISNLRFLPKIVTVDVFDIIIIIVLAMNFFFFFYLFVYQKCYHT